MGMYLKHQVVSLELAKRLKELGVKKESYFSWVEWGSDTDVRVFHGDIRTGEPITRIAPAYTVAELGELLPDDFCWEKRSDNLHSCFNASNVIGKRGHSIDANTEANARAKMLVYLLENSLITLG